MNTSTKADRSGKTSLTRAWIDFAQYHVGRYLGGRRGLPILAIAVLAVGVALNWSWLVAVGIAPLLVALAPCAVMCALHLCMNRTDGKSCSTQSATTDEPDARTSSGIVAGPEPSEPTLVASALEEGVTDTEGRAAVRTPSETWNERS